MRKKDLFITDSKLESFEDFFDEEKVEVTSWSFEEGKEATIGANFSEKSITKNYF